MHVADHHTGDDERTVGGIDADAGEHRVADGDGKRVLDLETVAPLDFVACEGAQRLADEMP